ERERRLHLIGAADHQTVGEIDAGGVDPEAHLMLLESWALGLFEPQHIGSAPLPATDRLHSCSSPYACRSRRRYRKTIGSGRLTGGPRRPSTAVTGDDAWRPNDGDPTRPAEPAHRGRHR